ncbi:MAG: hypothetical protein KGL63_11545 [Betaproteobacteria bacterium]|nr:hypothetical protein [Betaproteobacteria bacterium]
MNPYQKKAHYWTHQRIAQLALDNRRKRIARYPETESFGGVGQVQQYPQPVVEFRGRTLK